MILPLTLILVILGLNNALFLFAGVFLMCGHIFLKGPEGIYGLFFMLSFSPILKTSFDGFTLFNLLIFVYIARMILFNHDFRINMVQLITLVLFIAYCLLNAAEPELVELINLISYFLIALLMMNEIEAIELRKLLMYFIAGVIIASTMGSQSELIPGLSAFLRESQLKLEGEFIDRFSGIQYNPNFYTMDLTVAIASLLYMIRMNKNAWFDWILVVILFVFGVTSLSQSFLLTIVCTFAIFLLSGLSLNYAAMLKSVFVILVFVLIGSQLYRFPYWSIYMARLDIGTGVDVNLSDITTGRSSIWMQYWTLFLSNLRIFFFGVGLSVEAYHLKQAHNYFLELLVHLGIVGTMIYMSVMAAIFKPFQSIKRGAWICLLPLFALAMRAFAINLIFRESFMFYVILCIFIIKNEAQNDESDTRDVAKAI